MERARISVPARIYYEGLTAFTDTMALYEMGMEQYGIALLGISGPREAVRGIVAALSLRERVGVLLPNEERVELGFIGYREWKHGKSYGRSFTYRKSNSMHALVTSQDMLNGRIAFGRTRDEYLKSLHQKLTEFLPFPTHSSWSRWWLSNLFKKGYLELLITSEGFWASVFNAQKITEDKDELFRLLVEAIESGELPIPKAGLATKGAA